MPAWAARVARARARRMWHPCRRRRPQARLSADNAGTDVRCSAWAELPSVVTHYSRTHRPRSSEGAALIQALEGTERIGFARLDVAHGNGRVADRHLRAAPP